MVHDVMCDGSDVLEFSERVIHLELAYKHLVVVTTTQAYIYSTSNFNTPIIIDLREGSVSLALLSEKYFLTIFLLLFYFLNCVIVIVIWLQKL